MSMLKLVVLADDSLNTLVNEIRQADSAVVARIFEREANHFAKNELEQLRQRVIIGTITMSYVRHWNRKDGMEKVIKVLTEKGCTSLDATYCNNAAAFAFFYVRGVDIALTGGMRNWRAFFKLLQWKAQGKGAHKTTVLEFKKTAYEETFGEILKGEHTHKDEHDADVKTTIGSLTGVNFARIFGMEETGAAKLKLSLAFFDGMSKTKIKKSVASWADEMLKANKGKNAEVLRYFSEALAEHLQQTIIPVAPKPKRKKEELQTALANVEA